MKYKAGSQNILADTLSRRSNYKLAHLTMMRSSLTDQIRAAYARDKPLVAFLQALGSAKFKKSDIILSAWVRARVHRYTLGDRLLYYRTSLKRNPRVVIPDSKDLKYRILLRLMKRPSGIILVSVDTI